MPLILKQYYSPRQVLFFFGEAILVFAAINLVYLTATGPASYTSSAPLFLSRSFIVTAIFLLCLYFLDLYDLSEIRSSADVIARAAQAFGISCIILAFIYFCFPLSIIPTHIFWPSLGAVAISVGIWRLLYNYIINKRFLTQPVIIIGTGKMAVEIATELARQRDSGFRIVHFIGPCDPAYSLPLDVQVTPDASILPALCVKYQVERVVVAIDDRRGKTPIKALMDCKFMGFPIEYGINFFEKLSGKILVERVNPDWIIFSSYFTQKRIFTITKAIPECFLALIGLIIASPLLAIAAVIIKIESPGPVLYRQERVGLKGKTFYLYKLRSMRSDAEKDGPVWAMENDTRITRFGQFIRKTRIDELPQLFNVLKGDMSLVGPRPERPVFVEQLNKVIPYYALRHYVKPGVTGWAQIRYPYGASEEDALRKLEYDLYYVKYMSIQIDLWVIFQTIKTMLFLKGSR